jgi:hypothetical protein
MKISKRSALAKIGAALGAAVVLPQAARSDAWSRNPESRVKLGGAWVGEVGGVQWVSMHAPLDADGKTAVGKLQWLTIPAPFQQLMAAVGGDRMSEAVGAYKLINKDTAKYTMTWYIVASGKASLTSPVSDNVKAIIVVTGAWHYTGPDTAESMETLKVYAVAGDAEQHLFPAPGAVPIVEQTYDWHPQYRVTVP